MNPLDLMGPQFLGFYAVFGIGATLAAYMLRAALTGRTERRGPYVPGHYPGESEAYHVALLRGGPEETVQAALVRLHAQNLVDLEGKTVRATTASATAQLDPLERSIVREIGKGIPANNAVRSIIMAARPRLREMEADLERVGLLFRSDERTRFRLVMLVSLALVIGLGVAKLVVAASRGRGNVWFLIVMMIGFALLMIGLLRAPRLTRAGDDYLFWLRHAHSGLRDMVNQARRTSAGEIALCAAIYGAGSLALPPVAMFNRALKPPPQQRPDGGSGGSSCGSSSSDSGSSCGGGSCGGGGCGGCGG